MERNRRMLGIFSAGTDARFADCVAVWYRDMMYHAPRLADGGRRAVYGKFDSDAAPNGEEALEEVFMTLSQPRGVLEEFQHDSTRSVGNTKYCTTIDGIRQHTDGSLLCTSADRQCDDHGANKTVRRRREARRFHFLPIRYSSEQLSSSRCQR